MRWQCDIRTQELKARKLRQHDWLIPASNSLSYGERRSATQGEAVPSYRLWCISEPLCYGRTTSAESAKNHLVILLIWQA